MILNPELVYLNIPCVKPGIVVLMTLLIRISYK